MRVVLLVLMVSFCAANNFVDAMTSGEKEGDIYVIFDYTNSSSDISGTNYQDSTYLATSFGLHYTSAFYGYFRAHIGFRGAIPLMQLHKNIFFEGGKRDAARDFWRNNKAMFSRSYIEYFDGDTSVVAGRLDRHTDLIDDEIDGVWLQNKSLGYLLIDAVWIRQHGNVRFQKLSNFSGFDTKYGGAYYVGLNFDITDIFALKAYGLTSPQFYSFVALKAMIESDYVGASAGFVGGFEHGNSDFRGERSYLLHADVQGNFNIFYAKLGYIKTAPSIGIGSLGTTGNSFNPFPTFFNLGGSILDNERNVNLIYGKLGIDSSILDAYITYGYNTFSRTTSKHSAGKVNVYFDWAMEDSLNMIIYFLNTHGAKDIIPNLNQFGIAFKFGF